MQTYICPRSAPIVVIIAASLCTRAETETPPSAALAAKDVEPSAVMALMIGIAGASLTKVVLLKSIFKNPMVIAFLVVILAMAMTEGFGYNWLF